eukprot:TRINITY_DN2400_c0_g1_i1.p2 TRINITY_DN2400_c0_g1~~TRINITY_DN2400_c0_g1_i1.p2  ORF type:complete len:692 (-),score=192.97 TRINITY_DN2400_c0_g1_i1:2965-5040(-)
MSSKRPTKRKLNGMDDKQHANKKGRDDFEEKHDTTEADLTKCWNENIGLALKHREIEGPFFRAQKSLRSIATSKGLEDKMELSPETSFSPYYNLKLGSLQREIQSNVSFVSKLYLHKELKKHSGCVNTVQWNESGTMLITGSDDCRLNIWSGPPSYKLRKSLHTGHHRNIFSGVFVPYTGDKKIVSCGLDGEVRLGDIDTEEFTLLSSHHHMVYRIYFTPKSDTTFLTTHQDGYVRLYDLRQKSRGEQSTIVRLKNGRRHISANTLSYSPLNPNHFIVGGSDPFVRLVDLRLIKEETDSDDTTTYIKQFAPRHIAESASSSWDGYNVTGVDFNEENEIAITYSKEDVYLFSANDGYPTENIKKQDVICEYLQQFRGRRNVETFLKEVNFFGANSYVATGCDSGHLFIWDKKSGQLAQLLLADKNVVNGVAPHPSLPIIATCGIDSSAKIFELSDKVTFEPKAAQKVIKSNTSVHSEPAGHTISILQLWDLLAQLREGGHVNLSDLVGDEESEEDDDDDESFGEESDSDTPQELDGERGHSRVSYANEIRSRANELFREGKYEKAVRTYDVAIRKLNFTSTSEEINSKKNHAKILCLLNTAACSLKLKNYDRVVEDCSIILDKESDNLKALYRRGCAYFKRGDLVEARADLQKAAQLAPEDESIEKVLRQVDAKAKQENLSGEEASKSKEEE